jgi:hypothetical protein
MYINAKINTSVHIALMLMREKFNSPENSGEREVTLHKKAFSV